MAPDLPPDHVAVAASVSSPPGGSERSRLRSTALAEGSMAAWRERAQAAEAEVRSLKNPELKGSIGEGPNHSNFSDQSSVKILSK